MKVSPLYLTMIMLVLIIAPLASAELITKGTSLDATLLYYQPIPAQPGDLIDVYVSIENNGGTPSKAGTVRFYDSESIFVANEDDRVQEFIAIPSQKTFLVKTKARIAKSANEGIGQLKIRVQEEGKDTYLEKDLEISITGTSSSLSITKTQTMPKEVLPGEETQLQITVANVGETAVRNVDVALDLDDLSFAPTTSSDSKTIRSLEGGKTHTFSFDLVSFPDATPKAYQVPVTLTYDDETGNEKSQEETVGITVGTTPELLVYLDRVGLTQETKQGEVVIRFVNKGLAEIKLLEMQVKESETLKITSESPIIYVGNIDEDDYESANIRLKTTQNVEQIPITIKYRDSLNRAYEEEYTLTMNLQSANQNGGSSKVVWVVVILVLVGIIYWWRKRASGKKKR